MPITKTCSRVTALEELDSAEASQVLTIECSPELEKALRSEHQRLSRGANPRLTRDRFLYACLTIGLDRLRDISASEALELLDLDQG